ncbi:hypothetical protein M5689_014256 [Euphorbia peplus]|nr:hypothetical protein M5689_014256 [Euphorbia peplus]
MEDYLKEQRTPPVSLIALSGCPDIHSHISSYLHFGQSPIDILALPDLPKISRLLSSTKDHSTPSNRSSTFTAGILKNWLLKHWLHLCSDLENLKALVRPKNINLILIAVQSSSNVNRVIALRKNAELGSKYFFILNPSDSARFKQSIIRLAAAFAKLAYTYYRDEGRRIKTRVENKSLNLEELNVSYCFKFGCQSMEMAK